MHSTATICVGGEIAYILLALHDNGQKELVIPTPRDLSVQDGDRRLAIVPLYIKAQEFQSLIQSPPLSISLMDDKRKAIIVGQVQVSLTGR